MRNFAQRFPKPLKQLQSEILLDLAQIDKNHHQSSKKLSEQKKSEIDRFLKNKYSVNYI